MKKYKRINAKIKIDFVHQVIGSRGEKTFGTEAKETNSRHPV